MIILVAEIAGGVWAYMNRADLNKMVQESVRETVRRDYGKDEVTTKTFDLIQQSLKCCGSESFASWANSAYNGISDQGPFDVGIIGSLSPTYSVPKSCCVDPSSDICETTRKMGSLNLMSSAAGIIYDKVKNSFFFSFFSRACLKEAPPTHTHGDQGLIHLVSFFRLHLAGLRSEAGRSPSSVLHLRLCHWNWHRYYRAFGDDFLHVALLRHSQDWGFQGLNANEEERKDNKANCWQLQKKK